jgi:hypothetical protein
MADMESDFHHGIRRSPWNSWNPIHSSRNEDAKRFSTGFR